MNQNKINMRIAKMKQEWVNPRLWEWSYLTLKPLCKQVSRFALLIKKENKKNILDLGCGIKPYRKFFSFVEKYTGFDIVPGSEVDVVGENWNLPFRDNEFDSLLTTQVLEHTARIPETIREIKRVVKKNGLIFVSAPLTYPEHESPHDYFRFTRYGLMEMFKGFEFIEVTSSGGFLSTLFKLINVFLNYLPYAQYWAFPIFTINNIFGTVSDFCFSLLHKSGITYFEKIYEIYMRMPENFMIVMRNTKE